MKYYTPKGLYDIMPDSVSYWQLVEKEVREVMERYRYSEIRTPIMEKTEVFSRGVGEGTDIVSKEMYTFEDKGGRSVTLRPECTASVVRAYLEHKMYGNKEINKLYYVGPMFRYEAPQKGRSRQFHQYGAEAIGSLDPSLDVELIDLGFALLDSLGVEDVGLSVNSIGCKDDRDDYLEALTSYLEPKSDDLCEDCRKRLDVNPLRILDCKEESCKALVEDAPIITDYLCSECEEHFEEVRENLDRLDLEYSLDPHLVRGLDYYTKTVFEVFSSELGSQDALIGGGRYDNLVELFGGDPTPAVGFAAGIERLILILKEKSDILSSEEGGLDIYIAYLDEETRDFSLSLLRKFRRAGINAETDYLDKSLRGQLGYADRFGADYAAIVGPDELSEEEITLRDMEDGNQLSVPLDESVEKVKELLGK